MGRVTSLKNYHLPVYENKFRIQSGKLFLVFLASILCPRFSVQKMKKVKTLKLHLYVMLQLSVLASVYLGQYGRTF